MLRLTAATLFLFTASAPTLADSYLITIQNNLDEELLAPIVVTDASNDEKIFDGDYVSPAAETQILTGDPAMLVEKIGVENTGVATGTDGAPGVLLGPGRLITFSFETDAKLLRFLAMVAPTMVPDNYVSNVAELDEDGDAIVVLDRCDIGHDEGTKTRTKVGEGAATVTITRQ